MHQNAPLCGNGLMCGKELNTRYYNQLVNLIISLMCQNAPLCGNGLMCSKELNAIDITIN